MQEIKKIIQINKYLNLVKLKRLKRLSPISEIYNNRYMFNSISWFTYKYNYINLYNRKKKFYNIDNLKLMNINYYYNKKNNLYLLFNYNIYLINQFHNYSFNSYLVTDVPNIINLNFFNLELKKFIIKWLLKLYTNFTYNKNKLIKNSKLIKYNKYKLLLYFNKQLLKKKLKVKTKIWLNAFNSKHYKYTFNLLKRIKFLWRSKFAINLLLIYYFLLFNKNLNLSATILINYLTIQFRIIFSKYEQKMLLYSILTFNKIFIKIINVKKWNYLNKLILLQIIITGRWQRKRWVTPFPKLYISSPLQYNKLFKKIYKSNYSIIYKQSTIWTRKGVIGLRIFLLYQKEDIYIYN